MKESLRLSVPVPCMEDWGRMTAVERGRHCAQCCKTVVDFTGMSDGEVVDYFKGLAGGRGAGLGMAAGAGDGAAAGGSGGDAGSGGSGVCGRFAVDQLGRELAPMPVQRNGWKGWQLVVAGALVLGNGTERSPGSGFGGDGARMLGKPAVVDARAERDTTALMADTSKPVVMGEAAGPRIFGTVVRIVGDVEVKPDTSGIDMGIPMVFGDTVGVGKVKNDTVKMLPADTVTAALVVKPKDMVFSGLVKVTRDSVITMDTVSRVRAVVDTVVDRVVDLVRDTVEAVGGRGSRGRFGAREVVRVYPNPVGRGGTVRLEWRGEAGKYLVSMLSAGGSLVEEKIIEVVGTGQVDNWAVSGGLAAGIYFLRVARPGEAGFTAKLVIQ